MGCLLSINSELTLAPGLEWILTWETEMDPYKQHTKPQYIKILHDATYQVSYEIKWRYAEPTTQPLQVTIYKVHKEFMMESLHEHVTVCVGNSITVKKQFPFELKAGERICIGTKNFSIQDFILINCKLSMTPI